MDSGVRGMKRRVVSHAKGSGCFKDTNISSWIFLFSKLCLPSCCHTWLQTLSLYAVFSLPGLRYSGLTCDPSTFFSCSIKMRDHVVLYNHQCIRKTNPNSSRHLPQRYAFCYHVLFPRNLLVQNAYFFLIYLPCYSCMYGIQ